MATATCILSGAAAANWDATPSGVETPASCRLGVGRRYRQLKVPIECGRDSAVGNVSAEDAEIVDVLDMLEFVLPEDSLWEFVCEAAWSFSLRKVAEIGWFGVSSGA